MLHRLSRLFARKNENEKRLREESERGKNKNQTAGDLKLRTDK